jgi:uncharacterized protein YecE (DUF72 family)
MYYSAYEDRFLEPLAHRLSADSRHARAVWCVFDNTAHGAATANALSLASMLGEAGVPAASSRGTPNLAVKAGSR